jgi:lipoprotein-anchoring transpeptidase ErfK/SrfK
VNGRHRTVALVTGLALVAVGALPAAAAGQAVTTTTTPDQTIAPPPGQATVPTNQTTTSTATTTPQVTTPKVTKAKRDKMAPANLTMNVHGIHRDHKLKVGKRARVTGYLRPFRPDQHVRVKLLRHGHVVRKLNPEAKRVGSENKGRFSFKSLGLIKPGAYRVAATHDRTGKQDFATVRSDKFRIRYPDVDSGDRNSTVKLFNQLLSKQGYYTSHGKRYDVRTRWAVMAFRKVNGMKRSYGADPAIFKKLADGHGSFDLRYPGQGKHVEVDISRQVMVLANHGEPQHTFAVSTGAPATPTIRGHYNFYRRDAGYNSEGMYYSVYFHNGYATHGFDPVPPYPASHGCVRNPIPDSIFIYNWIALGDSIYLYD